MHATIGILMLETRFPRLYGDVGNRATWPFPVEMVIVRDATPERVVRGRADGLIDAFIAAGRKLAERGVDGITTTCGFLCLHQRQIADALPVPFAGSSLLQVPLAARLLPAGRRVGIITVDAGSLTPEHLFAAGADPSTPVMGTEGGSELSRVLLGNLPSLDAVAAQRDILEAGRQLLERHPDVGAIVLECANMPPYASALAAALRVPVYDWHSMVCWFAQGLRPRAFFAPAIAPATTARSGNVQ